MGTVREEFGKGNEFCKKITCKATGKSKDLIQEFRTSYYPRIAVTVDMIVTGTDVKPLEVVMFMRPVKSQVLYEQMHGRGGRLIGPDDLKAVTLDAHAKTHFVLVDCVGVTESKMLDTGHSSSALVVVCVRGRDPGSRTTADSSTAGRSAQAAAGTPQAADGRW